VNRIYARGSSLGIFLLALVAFMFVPASAPAAEESSQPLKRNAYVGDESCRSCHQGQTTNYHRTAHYFTSQLATTNSIIGKFGPGSNILETADTNLFFEMQATEAGHFQKAVRTVSPSRVGHRTERFDIVIGSGRKGQTYAFWKGDQLYQLPVSYWTELNEWVNSPGYPDGVAIFERPISPRCLECHATTFVSLATASNHFDKASLVLGMTCEKCHGPGGEHVALFQSKPPPKPPAAMAIINPAKFSRERQIDVCALCHGGGGEPIAPSLSFVPGDVLGNFLQFPERDPGSHVDVHGSQVVLMEKSRCFQSTNTMTCSTCHDVHTPQRDPAAFASKCLACHKVESCGIFPKEGHVIDRQCVVCHMPLQETSLIISKVNGKKVQPKVRNHQIAIYPDVRLP
jgi:hypothetical protein